MTTGAPAEEIDVNGPEPDLKRAYRQLAMKYQITAIPAFKVFEKGEVVKTVIGAKPKPALEADLAAYIS